MSQTSSSHGWFTQLQKHYPTSALVTELVQIHQERFIVKAIVQVSGAAIATSMAESANLETAEDQARLRVLDLLGISVIAKTSNTASPIVPEPLTAPIDLLPEIPSPEISSPEISSPEIPSLEISSAAIDLPIDYGFPIAALSSLDVEAIGVPAPLPLPVVSSPAPLADSMPFSTALFSTEMIPAEEDSPDEAVNDSVNDPVNDPVEEYLPSMEDYRAGYEDSDSEDAFSHNPSIEAETIAPIAPITPGEWGGGDQREDDLPAPLDSGKPKKAIAAENPGAHTLSNATEPDDLSTLIAHTDIEMDRIGWTKQEGRDYLKRTYKKSTRQRLDVDELMDFLNYLRALPSVNGI